MEKFFLTLLSFPQKLYIIDNQHIHRAVQILKIRQLSFFDGADEAVDKRLTTEELYRQSRLIPQAFMTDRVQQMGFAQAGIAVQKQGIVNRPGILADGDAACMGQPIARPDHETLEGIIRVQLDPALHHGRNHRGGTDGSKLHTDQVARDVLGGLGKCRKTPVLKILRSRRVRTADMQNPSVKFLHNEVVKPRADIDGVQGLGPFQNRFK